MSMTKETIAKITKASGVSAGELILVHFWGEDTDKEIADYFAASVSALGATPLVLQQARSINRDIFLSAKESCYDDRYFDLFSKFDAVLDVFAYQPVVLGYQIEEAQMALYSRYMSGLFHRFMSCKRFTQIRIPTQANGAESGLDPQEYIRRMKQPRENRIVCELGLGMNPHVTDLCGYPLLDEKMAGTFHIAVGENTMFGGENKASDHIDFVGCGKVEVITC